MELVRLGRQARRELAVDGELETYEALTEGHVYFYVDPEEGERSLIRVDQIAVELRWEAPDQVRQRIVGERSETRLPVREFRYYLDRLTLVQYGFGDEIQVGSGLDVAGVPHPLAHRADLEPEDGPYDFRISDSLTLTLPGQSEPLRLTEMEVRPRDPDTPGILGTLLLDRATGSIVRMRFGFTPASYVDPRTDRIQVEVDYGLWDGRYWLPNRQEIEVRRELPELDLGVGTVIRAVLQVGDYRFNVVHPPMFRELPPVTWAPQGDREGYEFHEGLLDAVERHGLTGVRTDADLRRLRAQATELLANRPPTGLSPLRFHVPRVSSAVRYSRAEGLVLGAGGSLRPTSTLRLRAHGGYAFGGGFPSGSVALDGVWGDGNGWDVRVGANQVRDLGLRPGSDPLLASLGALLRAEDYQDPFRSSSLRAGLEWTRADEWRVGAGLGLRRDRSLDLAESSSPLFDDRDFRPVRPVAAGEFVTGDLAAGREVELPAGGRGRIVGRLESLIGGSDGWGTGMEAELDGRWGSPMGNRELEGHVHLRSWAGDPLAQGHRLLGGRGTVPGYAYRSWAGRHLATATLEAATDLRGPLIRMRAGLHAGWAGGGDPEVMESWNTPGSRGIRPAVTLGLGLGWDVIRLQGARGLRNGEWQLLLSVDPRWWGRL
jgi:hypothetical protein